jgi:indole-3-acetate monooxygenase
MAGMIPPRGQAEPVDAGYRVKGSWAFGSGIHHAECAFVPGRPPQEGVRIVVLPRDQVVIHDNWQVAGLRASGSCDYSIENVFVPDEMTFLLMDLTLGNAVTGGAALRLGVPALVTPFHIGIALGIARRALDEKTEQAVEKGRGLPPSPLPTHPVHSRVFRSETRSGRTTAPEAVQGDSFDALAAAHSRALARLSGDIAGAIRAEAEDKDADKP